MQLKNRLVYLAVATSLVAGSAGCVVRAHGHIGPPVAVVEVDEGPPPPRYVTVAPRPGFIWIQGRWVHNGGRWAWRDGYWERERAGYVWTQGRWETRGRRHVWVEGSWRASSAPRGPAVRDHREPRRAPPPPPGPVVRDHR